MPIPTNVILSLLGRASRQLDGDLSLAALAKPTRRSSFEVHRAVRRVAGETTKSYTSRLRLERAAAQLIVDRSPILDIALANGFASHEVFTRAFLRRFRMSPRSYRARGFLTGATRAMATKHAALTEHIGPCIQLYQFAAERIPMSSISVTQQQLAPRPALVVRRKIASSELAQTLGEVLGRVFTYAQRKAIPIAGQPFTRFVTTGRGLITIEVGLPVGAAAPGEGEIEATELAGGPAAVAIHVGPYDKLGETHAAIERWIDAHTLETHGAPWETYVSDPAHVPDPAKWQTEVVYPLRG